MRAGAQAKRLAALLEQAYEGETPGGDGWHGPSLRKLLAGVTWEGASARPIAAGHSIWELVLHVAVWDEICARRLDGETIDMTTGSPGDWPEIEDPSRAGWNAALARLAAAQRRLVTTVRGLDDQALSARLAGTRWRADLMIEGTLHHDLYHAGQIALLRRALGFQTTTLLPPAWLRSG